MIYLDTSFLVSLYSRDVNSPAAANLLRASGEGWILSTLTELETVNALELRVFRKEISRLDVKASSRNFEEDLRQAIFRLIPLPETAFERARKISRQTTAKVGTRTADLLHVAAALELGAEGFFSFDQKQGKAAQAEGLTVNLVK